MSSLPRKYVNYVVTEGTLNCRHLIPSWIEFLESVQDQVHIKRQVANIKRIDWSAMDLERQYEFLDKLWLLLDEIAPVRTVFSAHLGDGSCFGFWPIFEDDEV